MRHKEVEVLKKSAYLNAGASFSWSAAPFLVSLVTFLAYTLAGHTLTAQKAFVSLALFNLLRFPLAMLPMMISALVEASVSLKRIRTFLLLDEKDPNNVIRDPAALHTVPFVDRNGTKLPSVIVHNGTFAWKDTEPILHDINFQIYPGTCIAVVGRVGSGKSSLVSALHGDMEKLSGAVVLPGSVAYVPQQAWIRNATLRDNILFGRPYNEILYQKVIQACALEDDLVQLPAGDMTEIGEKGINLSGGQKQRVSLARAVYQDADVYILDDCLSAVDSHVGKHIFQFVIGPEGCLAQKARLLVTHALHVLPRCDGIIMMRAGRILEQGTYQQLMSNAEHFRRLIDEFSNDSSSSEHTPGRSTPEKISNEHHKPGEVLPKLTKSVTDKSYSSHHTTATITQHDHTSTDVIPQQGDRSKSDNVNGMRTVPVQPSLNINADDDEGGEETGKGRGKLFNSERNNEVEVNFDFSDNGFIDKKARNNADNIWYNDGRGIALSVKTDETATAPVVVKRGIKRISISKRISTNTQIEELSPWPSNNDETVPLLKQKQVRKGITSQRYKRKTQEHGELARLIEREHTEQGGVAWGVYNSYFKAVGYPTVITLGVLYIITYGFQVGSNFWLSYWSSQDEHHQRDSNYTEPMTTEGFLGVYATLGLLNSIGTFLVTLLLAVGAIRAARLFHTNMIDRVLRAPMSFFDTTPMGRIVNRFSKDIYVIDETIPRSLRSFMSTFMQVVSIIVVISISTPIFMAAILPLGILYYYIQKFYVPTSRQLKRLESVSRSPIYAHFSETLAGVASIRAYRREADFIHENEVKVDTNLEAYYPSICSNRWLALRLEFLGNCIIFFAALFAVIQRGSINGGVVGLSLSYAMSVTQTLNWMVRMSSQLETDIVGVERAEEYCTLDMEQPPILPKRPTKTWPEQGEIAFDRYSVRYRETLDLVLRGITANVKASEKVFTQIFLVMLEIYWSF